jgi:hypothetical protein
MNESQIRAKTEELIKTRVGQYSYTLSELWDAYTVERENSTLDFLFMRSVRADSDIQRREETQRAMENREREITAQKEWKDDG